MRLENEFRVSCSPAETWKVLNDVPSMAPCMPGMELTKVRDENAWDALMHVKLGPLSLKFDSQIVREQVDHDARAVTLAVSAKEVAGRGGANAKVRSILAEHGAETSVSVVTDLTLRGNIARFGRGVVAEVARQLTTDFAACLASRLAEPEEEAKKDDKGQSVPAGLPQAGRAPVASSEVRPVQMVGVVGFRAVWRRLLSLFGRSRATPR
jgi:carbon monoxide dehydrogenase subunit G